MLKGIVSAKLYGRVVILLATLITSSSVILYSAARAQTSGTRLLRTPTVSANQIAFAFVLSMKGKNRFSRKS